MAKINFPANPQDGDVYLADNGIKYVWNADSNSWESGSPASVVGDTGATGPEGPPGATGPQGLQGEKGIEGATGPIGPQGTGIELKGTVPTVSDLNGITGQELGDTWIVEENGNGYTWNGSVWFDIGQLVGPEGPEGATGPRGATGAQGIQGDVGPQGDGFTGGSYNSSTGVVQFTSDDGLGFATLDLRGATGPQGLKGDKGDIGNTGPQGGQGIQGVKGDKGDKGDTGNTGAQGSTGPTGTFSPGASINSGDITATEITVNGDKLGPVAITLSGYNATIDGTYTLQPYVGFIGNRPDTNRDFITTNPTYQTPVYRKSGGPSTRTYDYFIVAGPLSFGPPERWSVVSTDIDLATQTFPSNRIADAITQQYGLQSVVDSTSPPVEDANLSYVLGPVGAASIDIGGQAITSTDGVLFQNGLNADVFGADSADIDTLFVGGSGNFVKLFTNNMANNNRAQSTLPSFDFAMQRGVFGDSIHFPAKFGLNEDRFVMLIRDNFQLSIDQDINQTYGISLGYYNGGNRFNHTSIFQANLDDSSVSLGDPQEDSSSPKWLRGTGSPEGSVSAPVGSFYSRTDGSSGSTWYVKESGTGNTGWAAK